jgi:hypothetical protein
LTQEHSEQHATFFLRDPEMLAWYLRARGYESSNELDNRKRLYAITKLDFHESIYARYQEGLLPEGLWIGWRNVLLQDLVLPVFAETWQNGHRFYDPAFVELVDGLLAELPTDTTDHRRGDDV